MGHRDIESCGYIAHTVSDMEEYCKGVAENVSQYIYKISVYECPEQEVDAKYFPRHGFAIFGHQMDLFKEVCIGMDPKHKHDPVR
jgi:hypothetical protein